MYDVLVCGVCTHERTCAYESPCNNCSELKEFGKESYFERMDGDCGESCETFTDGRSNKV